jgi:heat shock protein HslJ
MTIHRPLATALFCLAMAAPALAETPGIHASGNEPAWRAEVGEDLMVLRRIAMDDLSLSITARDKIDGADVITARDTDLALRATLRLTDDICHDTMSGMPFPMQAELAMGDTVLTGCAGDTADLLTGTDWQVQDIGGTVVIDATTVTLAFDADGRVAGSAGCNRFNGAYDLTGEGIGFGPVATTMMACPEAVMTQEHRFTTALGDVIGVDIDATGALVLRGVDGPVMLARRP